MCWLCSTCACHCCWSSVCQCQAGAQSRHQAQPAQPNVTVRGTLLFATTQQGHSDTQSVLRVASEAAFCICERRISILPQLQCTVKQMTPAQPCDSCTDIFAHARWAAELPSEQRTCANQACTLLSCSGTALANLEAPAACRASKKSVSAFFLRSLDPLAVSVLSSVALCAASAASSSIA